MLPTRGCDRGSDDTMGGGLPDGSEAIGGMKYEKLIHEEIMRAML